MSSSANHRASKCGLWLPLAGSCRKVRFSESSDLICIIRACYYQLLCEEKRIIELHFIWAMRERHARTTDERASTSVTQTMGMPRPGNQFASLFCWCVVLVISCGADARISQEQNEHGISAVRRGRVLGLDRQCWSHAPYSDAACTYASGRLF